MKYKKVYEVIRAANCTMTDISGWRKLNPLYIDTNRPLWLILEAPGVNLRIWVTQEFEQRKVSYLPLEGSIEDGKLLSVVPCSSQDEMVCILGKVLKYGAEWRQKGDE